jgi:hypothetical protein
MGALNAGVCMRERFVFEFASSAGTRWGESLYAAILDMPPMGA